MKHHDVIVIGAGPGGYVAAIRAAQLGLNVACIDENDRLGGTCLRVGCIPSKAMLESSEKYHEAKTDFAAHGVKLGEIQLDLATMLKRKDAVVASLTKGIEGLFRKNKITRYQGRGKIAGPGRVDVACTNGTAEQLEGKHIIIATGSVAATLPGVEMDGDLIGTSTEALSYDKVPGHLVVIGAGYIGLEMGSVWKRLGAKVTVVEFLDRILPGMDSEIAQEATRIFKKQEIEFHLGAKVKSARVEKGRCIVEGEGFERIECDRVLVAVGRRPATANLGLETVGITPDERGRVPVNAHFQTAAAGVYAIGDAIAGPMLAHKAEDEGIACVEHFAIGYGHVNYDAIPGIVYTHPEIASVGKTEDQLKEAGVDYRKGVFHFRGNGRAMALGQTEGRIKMLADRQTDRILGVHIIGARAGDLIAEAAAAIEFAATSEDIARTSHAHPTLAEAMREAAFAVEGRAIHA